MKHYRGKNKSPISDDEAFRLRCLTGPMGDEEPVTIVQNPMTGNVARSPIGSAAIVAATLYATRSDLIESPIGRTSVQDTD